MPQADETNVISLQDIFKQSQKLSETATDVLAKLGLSEAGLSAATEGMTKAEREEAEAKNEALRASQDITLRKNKINSEVAANFGTDPRTSSSILTTMSSSIISEEAGVQEEAKQLEAKQKISPFDDFLGWFQNQFELPGEEQAHGTRVAALTIRMGTLQKLQAATHDQIALNEALDTNTSDSLIAAKSKENFAVAAKQTAQAQYQLAKTGLEVGNIRLATSAQQLHAIESVHAAQTREQELELARERLSEATKQRMISEELKQLQIMEKEDKIVAMKNWDEKLKAASAVLGYDRPVTFKDLQMMTPENRQRVEMIALDPDIQAGRLGAHTPWETINNAQLLNAPLTPTIRATTAKLLVNQRASVIGTDALLWKSYDKAVQDQKMKQNFDIWIKQQTNNIPEQGGLYSAPSLSSIGKIPAIAATSIYKDVAALARDPEYPTKPQDLYNVAVKKVREGGNPDLIARELSGIFKAIAIDNSAQRGYQRFALPMQKSYNATVNTGIFLEGSRVIDFTNYNQVGNFLLRSANRRDEDIISPFGVQQAKPAASGGGGAK